MLQIIESKRDGEIDDRMLSGLLHVCMYMFVQIHKRQYFKANLDKSQKEVKNINMS